MLVWAINQVQIGKLDASIQQAQRLANATERATQNIIDADRPWIGGSITVKNFEAGKSPSATCAFINSGRRPALIEDASCHIEIDKWSISLPPSTRKPGRSIVLPGQPLTSPVHFFHAGKLPQIDGNNMTAYLLNAFDTGEVHIKVIGRVDYRDVKGHKLHYTQICVTYIPTEYDNPAAFYDCNGDYGAN